MKKCIALGLVLIFAFTLAGCGKKDNQDEENVQDYFSATVLEVMENSILVECIQSDSGGISSESEVMVGLDVVAESDVPELAVGDSVQIVFDGVIMESYPLQIGTVYAIYHLDEQGEAIPNN